MLTLKDMPSVIYIQIEDDISEFDDLGECTWCVDKINDSDIKYILEAVKQDIYDTNFPSVQNVI